MIAFEKALKSEKEHNWKDLLCLRFPSDAALAVRLPEWRPRERAGRGERAAQNRKWKGNEYAIKIRGDTKERALYKSSCKIGS